MWNYSQRTSCAPKFSIASVKSRRQCHEYQSKWSILFVAAGLPKHNFPPSWAQHFHLAGTTVGTHSDLFMAGQGLESGMTMWWGGRSKKTQLSIPTVPGRQSALTSSETAPNQERKRNSLGGQGWNSKILAGLRNSYRCYTWRGENGREADEEMNKLQACKQWATTVL